MGIDTTIVTGYGIVLESYYAEQIKDELDQPDQLMDITVFRDSENRNSDVFICLTGTVQTLFDRKTGGLGGFGWALGVGSNPAVPLYIAPSERLIERFNEFRNRIGGEMEEPGLCIFSYNR